MKILSIEISGNSAVMLIVEGNKSFFTVTNVGKLLSIPKGESHINNILEFQTNFSMYIQNLSVSLVVSANTFPLHNTDNCIGVCWCISLGKCSFIWLESLCMELVGGLSHYPRVS